MNATARPLYIRKMASGPIVQEAGWAPVLVWTCVGKLIEKYIKESRINIERGIFQY